MRKETVPPSCEFFEQSDTTLANHPAVVDAESAIIESETYTGSHEARLQKIKRFVMGVVEVFQID